MGDLIQEQVDNNYEAFKKLLPDIIEKYNGKFALMRHKEIVNYFDSINDAIIFAKDKYEDDLFSIQEVTNVTPDLGYFSNALNISSV